MWYEQLWSGGVVLAFVQAALYISGPFNKLDTGRWHRRNTEYTRKPQTKRDEQLTGNYYVMSTLDSIKD